MEFGNPSSFLGILLRGRLKTVLIVGAVAVACVAGLAYWLSSRASASGLDSPDPAKRLKAVEEIGQQKTESACQTLRPFVRDADVRVAVEAVRRIGEMGTESGRKVLIEVVNAPSIQGKVRGEAAAALGKDKAVDPQLLTGSLRTETDPQVRAGAAKGLARLRERTTVPDLFKGLSDPDPQVRIWCVTAISNIAGIRFDYQAHEPPATQTDKIQFIGQLLRERKLL